MVVATAQNERECAEKLALLDQASLPNATKYLVSTEKFDGGGIARTLNAESAYPAELPHLRTLSAWADTSSDTRVRDGFDIFCLRIALAKADTPEIVVLLRDALPDSGWDLENDALFEVLMGNSGSRASSVAFNLLNPSAPRFFDFLWDIYASGVAYAMSPYDMEMALSSSAEAANIISEQTRELQLTR